MTYFLPNDVAIKINDIQIRAPKYIRGRPAAIEISSKASEIKIDDFADQRFDSVSWSLVPVCELVSWNGLVLISGLPAVVVASNHGFLKCDLFRSPSEDRGFYQAQWIEVENGLILIYESGLIFLVLMVRLFGIFKNVGMIFLLDWKGNSSICWVLMEMWLCTALRERL